MSYTRELLETHPGVRQVDRDLLADTIDAIQDCAQACNACADACLSESTPAELVRCISLDLDCAEVCYTTVRILSRQSDYDPNVTGAMLEACARVCRACAAECSVHGQDHTHCKVCAEACERAEQACNRMREAVQQAA